MRQIGTLGNPQQAQRFVDYLLTQGIKASIDVAGDEPAIWIRDEDHVERARVELEQFRTAPDDARYQDVAREAKQARAEAEAYAKRFRQNQVDVRRRWVGGGAVPRGLLTMSLIGISIAVSLLADFGTVPKVTRYCLLSQYQFPMSAPMRMHLPEVRQGQVWRLVSPIFLHLGVPHLVFNMLWLYQLGNLIEARRGMLRYGALVLTIAVLSNLAQFLWNGPDFGGMSGVVYGLFGYIWMKARFQPGSGFYLQPNTVFWMLGWFVLCATGIIGNVANMAHGAGLAVGMIIGIAPLLWRR